MPRIYPQCFHILQKMTSSFYLETVFLHLKEYNLVLIKKHLIIGTNFVAKMNNAYREDSYVTGYQTVQMDLMKLTIVVEI